MRETHPLTLRTNPDQDAGMREIKVMRRYHVQNREDYHSYNKLCGQVRARLTLSRTVAYNHD